MPGPHTVLGGDTINTGDESTMKISACIPLYLVDYGAAEYMFPSAPLINISVEHDVDLPPEKYVRFLLMEGVTRNTTNRFTQN